MSRIYENYYEAYLLFINCDQDKLKLILKIIILLNKYSYQLPKLH